MRTYKVSNTYHKVFDDREELPSGIDVIAELKQEIATLRAIVRVQLPVIGKENENL